MSIVYIDCQRTQRDGRRLIGLIQAGNREAVLRELEEHGDRTFMREEPSFSQQGRELRASVLVS